MSEIKTAVNTPGAPSLATAATAKRRSPLAMLLLLAILDALMAIGAYVAAYAALLLSEFFGSTPLPGRAAFSTVLVVVALTMLTVFYVYGLYHLKRGVSRIDEFYKVCSAVSLATVMAVAINSFLMGDTLPYPRGILVLGWILTIIFVTFERMIYRSVEGFLRKRGVGRSRVLIVGAGETGQTVLQQIMRSPELGYQAVGFLDDAVPEEPVGLGILGRIESLARAVRQHDVDDVIIALSGASHQRILDIIALCQDENVNIRVFPDAFQIITSNQLSVGDLNGLPLLSVRDTALRGWDRALKRVVDVVFSGAFLVLFSPLFLIVAVMVKLNSRGPVFFVQERVGLDGQPIRILKFRSMRVDAETKTGPVWAKADDPRKTGVGRLIRRLSIDEMPQFINVLLGEMSIVGPRPERPVFVEQFKERIPSYMRRHKEKTGLTGWAQVNGLRGDTSIDERTRYDLYYIENWSLLFDFKIMAKTVVQIFRDRNAY
jgi:exopolysaccharide biosynthesis polyprenyl glycosylphosphotransferase